LAYALFREQTRKKRSSKQSVHFREERKSAGESGEKKKEGTLASIFDLVRWRTEDKGGGERGLHRFDQRKKVQTLKLTYERKRSAGSDVHRKENFQSRTKKKKKRRGSYEGKEKKSNVDGD